MATETAGKAAVKGSAVASQSKTGSLISPKLLLFMVAMVLANIGGNMYDHSYHST